MILESIMIDRDGSDPEFWESFKHANLEDMPAELREAYLRTAPPPEDLHTFFAKSVQRMLNFKGWTSQEVQSIDAPTLVIMGDRDVASPEHAVQMFRLIPNSRLAILPDTDHMTIVKRADWLLPMIGAFLDLPMPQTQEK